jgi:DNA repair protein RadA/Sms
MDGAGLHEVRNPSQLFLGRSGTAARPSGSCVVASIVGSRPVLVEIQALVGETSYGTPQRLAANVDRARLAMILAVLERRAGMALGSHDVYASVAGGLRIAEPAADLGIALAIASAFRGRPLAPGTVAFGELGLSGEVRAVSQRARRTNEARKLGFTHVVAPPGTARDGNDGSIVAADLSSAVAATLG